MASSAGQEKKKQHAVLLGRDSWMRFNTRSYRALPPRPHDNRVFGELTLSHHATTGMSAYAIDPIAADGGFHLLYDGTVGVTLSDEPQQLEVNLMRSNGSPALTGHYLVAMLPQPGISFNAGALRCLSAAGAPLN